MIVVGFGVGIVTFSKVLRNVTQFEFKSKLVDVKLGGWGSLDHAIFENGRILPTRQTKWLQIGATYEVYRDGFGDYKFWKVKADG